MPKIKPAKNQINNCKRDLSSISTHRKSWSIKIKMKTIKKKKRRRKVNTVTVPKLFKTPKFPMEWVFFYTNSIQFPGANWRFFTFLALKFWFRASENVKWKSRNIVEFVSLAGWWAETINESLPFWISLPLSAIVEIPLSALSSPVSRTPPPPPPCPPPKHKESLWPLINVRLRAAKVRCSQILEYSVHCITLVKERKEGKRQPGSRFYTTTRLWVVFSLSTRFFATVNWSRRRLRRGTKYELPKKGLRGRLDLAALPPRSSLWVPANVGFCGAFSIESSVFQGNRHNQAWICMVLNDTGELVQTTTRRDDGRKWENQKKEKV